MYESFFIEPPKGQEAIKSVLIVIGDLLSDLTSSVQGKKPLAEVIEEPQRKIPHTSVSSRGY